MIEHFHIIVHSIALVVFLLFIIFARRSQPHAKKIGKSNISVFKDTLIPSFDHWSTEDQRHVGNLAYTLLKLNLADADKDKRSLGFSRQFVFDQFAAYGRPRWRTGSSRRK